MLLLIVAATLAGRAQGADAAGPEMLRAATCAAWNKTPASARAPQLSLLFDYITQHDREPDRDYYAGQIDLTDGVDAAEIASLIDSHCAANPGDNFEQTAAALVRALEARWMTRKNGR